MYSVSASELLRAWERAVAQQPIERALTLLCTTSPEASPEAIAQLSIGVRDERLLRLREHLFGSQLTSLASCPQCAERLEVRFLVEEIMVCSESEKQSSFSFSVDGYELQFRLPSSLDLKHIASCADFDLATSSLLSRCLLSAHLAGEEKSLDELPAEVVEAVSEEMGRCDPQSDVQLALSCPKCAHRWQLTFDIVSFFWSELNAWAQRMLREIHVLAFAYGWREEEILSLSAVRRHFYAGIIGG